MVVFGSAQADLISGVNIIFCQSAKTVAFNTQGLVAQGTFINLNRSDYLGLSRILCKLKSDMLGYPLAI